MKKEREETGPTHHSLSPLQSLAKRWFLHNTFRTRPPRIPHHHHTSTHAHTPLGRRDISAKAARGPLLQAAEHRAGGPPALTTPTRRHAAGLCRRHSLSFTHHHHARTHSHKGLAPVQGGVQALAFAVCVFLLFGVKGHGERQILLPPAHKLSRATAARDAHHPIPSHISFHDGASQTTRRKSGFSWEKTPPKL